MQLSAQSSRQKVGCAEHAVPSLFRQMPISDDNQRELTSGESPVRPHIRRYDNRRRKFELYFDV
jgi:hypothetical protein